MNFKPVVASLFALGLVSSPAVLAKNHTKHHKHRGVTTTRPLLGDYKTQFDTMAHNNASSPVSSSNWTNRIHISGEVNVDARYASRGPIGIVPVFLMSDDSHEVNVNNANLYVDAHINRCVLAHIGIAYVDDGVNLFDTGLNTLAWFTPVTKSVRSDKGSVFAGGTLSVDEAYITIRDFALTPVYFRVGKMYTPFGSYKDPYPLAYSLSQLISQTRATSAEAGFVSSYGLYGVVWAMDGKYSSLNWSDEEFDPEQDGNGWDKWNHGESNGKEGIVQEHIPYTRINNWGIKLGYRGTFHSICYHVNGSYMKDIRDVNYFSDIQDLFEFTFVDSSAQMDHTNGFGMRQAGGVSLHGDFSFGPVSLEGNYVAALRNMIHETNGEGTNTRAWAGDITGTYFFNLWGFDSNLDLSYQRSGQAGGVMPEWRFQGDVNVIILPHTTVTVMYQHNRDYDKHEDSFCHFINEFSGGASGQVCGGTDRSSNTAAIRLGVVF